MDEHLISIADVISILKRRKWSLILPMLPVVMIALFVALTLPPVYRTSATILIEEQEIPSDFVRTMVTSYAEQRIQSINQMIMTSKRLIEIINRFDLYRDLRDKRSMDEIVAQLRKDTKLKMISATGGSSRKGSEGSSIAFTLSFEADETPSKVQIVTNELTSLFLETNLRVRVKQTKETTDFLESEMNKVKSNLDFLEAKIATFKEKNFNNLPEMLPLNTENLSDIERNMDMLRTELRSHKEREGYLQASLANLSLNIDQGNENNGHLKQLKLNLAEMESRLTAKHPDVIKIRKEIEDIMQMEAVSKDSSISKQKEQNAPDNPVYITLASQLASTQTEIKLITAQLQDLNKMAMNYRQRIETAFKVEQPYRTLLTERDNTKAKYNDLMQKLMEARVSQGLEKEQKGERFTLIDPARLPEKPFKPDRMAIVLIGIVLGIGVGVGTAVLLEFSDDRIYSSQLLIRSTNLPILAGVPTIQTARELSVLRRKRLVLVCAMVAFVAMGLVLVHTAVMDLDVVWAKIMQRIQL